MVINGLKVFSENKCTSKQKKSPPKENLNTPICDSQPKIIKKPLQERQRSSSFNRINMNIFPNEEMRKNPDSINSKVISEEKNRKMASPPYSNKNLEEKANSVLPNICNSLFLADKLKNGNGVFMGVPHKSLLNKAKSEPKFAIAIVREEKKKQIRRQEEIKKTKKEIIFPNEGKIRVSQKKIRIRPLQVFSSDKE